MLTIGLVQMEWMKLKAIPGSKDLTGSNFVRRNPHSFQTSKRMTMSPVSMILMKKNLGSKLRPTSKMINRTTKRTRSARILISLAIHIRKM